MDWLILTAALSGETDSAIDLIDTSVFFRNYRWVVTEPSMDGLRTNRRFQDLVRRLYGDWQRNVSTLQAGMKYPPPAMPTPDQYFGR